MPKHRFRISLEAAPETGDRPAPLSFEFESHDDVIALASRLGKNSNADLLFFVGLKLFGEALLARRGDPMFAEFRPHFGALMKRIKGTDKD